MEQIKGNQNFAVLLCSLTANNQVERRPRELFEGLFTKDTEDGLNHFWRDASQGNISLNGSRVFDWRELPQSLDEFRNIMIRTDRIRIAAEHFAKEGNDQVDFRSFIGIIVVTDHDVDLTSPRGPVTFNLNGEERGYRVVICSQTNTHTAIAHEMGHSFGLHHSRNTSPISCDPANDGTPGAYCDRWDIMSAQNVNSIQRPRFGATGPLPNAVNMSLLGWLHESRISRFTGNSDSMQLRPLSRPDLPGPLAIRFGNLLIEFRMNTGWDEGFGVPGVLIHNLDDESSVLMGFPATEFLPSGGSYAEGDPTFGPYRRIHVRDIDPVSQSAIVSFLRKEEEGVTVHVPQSIWHWILEGVIGIGPGGGVVVVPPRPPIRDILIGLAINELADSIQNIEHKAAVRQASMNLITETAKNELSNIKRA